MPFVLAYVFQALLSRHCCPVSYCMKLPGTEQPTLKLKLVSLLTRRDLLPSCRNLPCHLLPWLVVLLNCGSVPLCIAPHLRITNSSCMDLTLVDGALRSSLTLCYSPYYTKTTITAKYKANGDHMLFILVLCIFIRDSSK